MMQVTAMANKCVSSSLVKTPTGTTTGLLSLGFSCKRRNVSFSARQWRAAAHMEDGVAAGQTLLWRESVRREASGDFGLLSSWRERSMFSVLSYIEESSLGREGEKLEAIAAGLIGAALLLVLTLAAPFGAGAAEDGGWDLKQYFGTAASASSYGGYGGNSNKQTTAEYTFQVPMGWKEKTITKIEKGTNGTDAEFDNPKHKEEKVYVTYLANFRRLAPIDKVLENLALSDPVLQDIIAYADGKIKSADRTDSSGQQYYDYEIDSPAANVLVSVTCAKNKLYAHFIKAGTSDWNRDQKMLRQMHQSFQTIGSEPLGY